MSLRALARDWASSVAAVRAATDADLAVLAATLAAVPPAAMSPAAADLYLLTKSEVSIRRVEVSPAAPVHPHHPETTWPTATP